MTRPKEPSQWCKHLRWKDYERDREDLSLVVRAFEDKGEFYNCGRTAQTAGWDDGLAGSDACGPGRSCYEEHPLLVLRRVVA